MGFWRNEYNTQGLGIDTHNRQLHPSERKLAQELASKPDTEAFAAAVGGLAGAPSRSGRETELQSPGPLGLLWAIHQLDVCLRQAGDAKGAFVRPQLRMSPQFGHTAVEHQPLASTAECPEDHVGEHAKTPCQRAMKIVATAPGTGFSTPLLQRTRDVIHDLKPMLAQLCDRGNAVPSMLRARREILLGNAR